MKDFTTRCSEVLGVGAIGANDDSTSRGHAMGAETVAAYLIVGLALTDYHRSLDVVRFQGGLANCQQSIAQTTARLYPLPAGSRLAFEPYCTEEKPSWWVD
jgi:hypothetical protein